MKKLGFGLMRLPLKGKFLTRVKQTIDIEEVTKMVDMFIERGFTYFDTAYIYHGMHSESIARKVLVERYPREAFTLATKLPLMPIYIRTEADQIKIFDNQLKKCGVEFFDYYLLHALDSKGYALAQKLHSFEFVQQKKEEGKIKHIGFSFHDSATLLDEILTAHPEVDFVQLQINYFDWESDVVQSRLCYEVATKHGKPVIVMEPVKGGTLAKVPAKAERLFKEYSPQASVSSWAIRYAASLDNVIMVLSGMSNMAQLEDNTSYMQEFKPLNDDERSVIDSALKQIKNSVSVPCTGCAYCADGCPKNIAIPTCFALYNAWEKSKHKVFSPQKRQYNKLIKNQGKASDCIGCRQCEKACPQHIKIIDELKNVSKAFGK